MIIANKELLDAFVQKHAQSAGPLNKWVEKVKSTIWHNHSELKQTFPSADYVKNGRYVFNISGNNYRVVAVVIFIGGVMNILKLQRKECLNLRWTTSTLAKSQI